MKFILRVDDVGQDLTQTEPDVELRTFRKWWEAGGWGGEPVYLGVVPAVIGQKERDWLLDLEIKTEAVISLHGWDHAHRNLSPLHLEAAQEVFPLANTVIPPYNMYDVHTIRAMGEKMYRPVLFGGFNGEHHTLGNAPCLTGGVLHLNAERILYNHSHRLVDVVKSLRFDVGDYPVVVTLHHRWDAKHLDGVRALHRMLEGNLYSVEEAFVK